MAQMTVTLDYIVDCIAKAGFNPVDQLYAYLLTGDIRYITRTGNARALIAQLDRVEIEAYVNMSLPKRNEDTVC